MSFDYKSFHDNADEKPLDHLLEGGGFAGIFHRIGIVGDSLSSGELEAVNQDGTHTYHDFFDFSWGQCMARILGNTVYTFSRGGMSAKHFCESFGESMGYWDAKYACQAYIIALGVNDIYGQKQVIGSVDDVDFDDYRNSKKTVAGYYSQIIQRLKAIQPRAKFFLMTMPHETRFDSFEEENQKFRHLLYDFAEKFENTYVLDFYQYAPEYDEGFKDLYFNFGHMNPLGYQLTARMVISYIDYIIRHRMEDFREVGFIGTDLHTAQP